MSKGKNANKAANTTAPASETAASTNVANTTTATEGSENSAEGEGEQPAAPVATAKKAAKMPPLKQGKRAGIARTRGTSQTYNFAEAAYGDIDKFVKHIVNGCYVPLFNGCQHQPVDESQPVFKTAEEAFAAGAAIEFGALEGTHFIGYVQNRKFDELGKPELKTSKPNQKYHSFLTAASVEDVAKAKANYDAFMAMPWNAGVKEMVTFLPTLKATYPVTPLAEVASPAAEAAAAE